MTSTAMSLVPEENIQQVKDLIESRQFMRARLKINHLQSSYPSSAYVLALKALVYKNTALDDDTLSVCEESLKNFGTDETILHEVLNTLQIVFYELGHHGLAIRYYENALKECSNLELMKGYFNCCHHESSFVKQLEISLEMYRSSEGCMFLFWSVFSIQLQVCHLLLKEYLTSHKLDEPETFLVYISAPAHHDMTDPVRAIMSKLGPTLLVAEVGSQRVKGVRLCAHVSDYIAAAEVLGLLCGSSYQLYSLNEFMVESDRGGWPASSPRPLFEICKLSQLCNDPASIKILVALKETGHLVKGLKRCLDGRGETELNEAVDEYFNRHAANAKVCLQVLAKDDALRLIENIQGHCVQEEFNSLITIYREISSGLIEPGRKTQGHGTSIALRRDKFIILATDGKFTPTNTFEALSLKADKLKNFSDMSVALTGDWKNLSKMLNTLSRCMKFLKDNGKRRPAVSRLADFARKRLFSRVNKTEIIFGAFDQLKDGQPVVPCIFYADEQTSFEIKELFFCAGTGSKYANAILSKLTATGNIDDEAEAIAMVELSLVYANMFDPGCTGGWASIHVIRDDLTVRTLPREHISSTLRGRHHRTLKLFEDGTF